MQDSPTVSLQTVNFDQHCIRCGYSLRGLLMSAVCPECATAVERSLRGDLLVYSSPAFVATLKRGAGMVMSSVILLALSIIAIVALVIATRFGFVPSRVVGSAVSTVMLLIYLLHLLGWWTLTTPDSDQLTDNKGDRVRMYVRLVLPAAAIMKLFTVVLPLAVRLPAIVTELAGAFDTIVSSIGLIVSLLYVRWLADRLSSADLYQRTRLIITAFVILLIAGVANTVTRFAGLAVPDWLSSMLGFAAGILTLAAFGFYFGLFSALRKELNVVIQTQRKLPTSLV